MKVADMYRYQFDKYREWNLGMHSSRTTRFGSAMCAKGVSDYP